MTLVEKTQAAAMRPAVAEALGAAADERDDFVVLGADGHSLASNLMAAHPHRYIDVGIAEQNLVGVAAGLARGGHPCVVGAMASFLSRRANEQIRNDVCNANLDVTFIGKGGGVSYGTMGATHHAPEDLAVFKAMPNTRVFCPADIHDAVWSVREALAWGGPAYVRIGSREDEIVFTGTEKFSVSAGRVLRTAGPVLVVAAGASIAETLRAADEVASHGVQAGVLALTCLKPFPTAQLLELAASAAAIITVEEHSRVGGLGSQVALAIAGTWQGAFRSLALEDEYPPTCDRAELFAHFGIDARSITEAIMTTSGTAI